ncbi:MAG: helicase, partial [Mesorhizobium sp.]
MGSTTRQQAEPSIQAICRLKPFTVRRVGGFETTLSNGQTLIILSGKTATKLHADLILLIPDAQHPKEIKEALERGEGRWLRPTPLNPALLSVPDITTRLAAVTMSWDDAFHLREGRAAMDG